MIWLCWLLPLAGYAIGSVSFAYYAGKMKGIDLRQHGSGNLGATNAGRVLGKGWFAAVFVLDVLKGLIPTLIARFLCEPLDASLAGLGIATGAGAIAGHFLPCWHGFKGGKAVATSLGVLIALVWMAAAIAAAAWLLAWGVGRLCRLKADEAVGPASMVAALVVPVAHALTYPTPAQPAPLSGINLILTLFVTAAAVVVLIKHRRNAQDLLRRIRGHRAPPPAP